MIVRERENDFIMIEQDHHAKISGEVMGYWQESLFIGKELRKSVEFAIENHDYGWKNIDKMPFWNDMKQSPYSFSNFPLPSKVLVYSHGINEVEKQDPYAALLCSHHYSHFLMNDSSQEARSFIREEKWRQNRIIDLIGKVNQDTFQFHYGLLKLGDNFSLYLCLNEPGILKEKEHYFFRNGLELPPGLKELSKEMELSWKDVNTICVTPFPFHSSFIIKLMQKVVSKESIMINGLVESYQNAPYEEIELKVIPRTGR